MKSSSETLPLLVEIGCEEIPARFLAEAQTNFGEALAKALGEARLLPASAAPISTYSTPRRLAAWAPAVLSKQAYQVEEILGPPVKVAFDLEGKPTKAAESFAAKNGVRLADLARVTTPKGEYLAIRKTTRGRPVAKLLSEIIPAVLAAIPLPKSMYWTAKAGPKFFRPIRWILAILGEGKQSKVVPVEIAGVRSGALTYGHRGVKAPGARVQGFKDYAHNLRKLHVEINPEARRERVRKESKVLLEELRLRYAEDKWLEDWLVNSTEWPHALLGSFDACYLHLPREILVTVMRDQQKYFAVDDRKGNLQPRFVAVLNQDADRRGLVRRGHERVLAARFADAEFFWKADQQIPLAKRPGLLEQVTYQAELGSYAAKVRRVKVVASNLCDQLGKAGKLGASETAHVARASELSKCDLTTQMVHEFPELQGVVGGLYARAQGEPSEVSDAIYDHYLPRGVEDRCPKTVVGSVVSLADKIDSVVGGFAVGHEPTGSSDPFALRRLGNGIVKVVLELGPPIQLKTAVQEAVKVLNVQWRTPTAEVFAKVLDFLEERLRYYLETVRKLRYDTVRAVLAAGWDPMLDALRRAEALEKIRDSENLEALSQAAKRIKNILAKSATASDWQPGEVDTELLREPEESGLYTVYVVEGKKAEELRAAGDYLGALETIRSLRPYVDRFFDKVLVMAEDRAARENRLRLLGKLDELFSGIAHFSEIAAAPSHVDASTWKAVTSGK